jgi:hypothetical protein
MTEEPTQQHLEVDGVRVYATLEGNRLACMVRATDKATFDAQALAVGLKVYQNPATPAVVDPETGEVITPAVEASGPLIPSSGTTITELGPLVLTPGTYDEEGNELTPPVVDSRWHVNYWLAPWLVERGGWKTWGVMWTQNGQPVDPNNAEEAVAYQGIELIDPLTVSSPSNILL